MTLAIRYDVAILDWLEASLYGLAHPRENRSDDTDGPLTHFSIRKNAVMGAVAHAQSKGADPQSGPAQPGGVTGFFHYNARWIIAEQGSIAGLGKSNYINRLCEFAHAAGRDPPRRDWGRSSPGAGLSTSDYINRTEGGADNELGASILITRGLPVDTGAGLARLLDARERKRDRTYRCYGGRLPRVGSHFILSFRHGLSAEAATESAWEHARILSDRLRVPLEGRIHNKDGAPDHLHLIVGTRVVDHGKLGRKCRELDAVSEKHDGKSLVEGVLGPTIEALRADWAERMRRASGDKEIDHRSYARRGMAVYPVTHVSRREIEYQKRRGRADWRHERIFEMQERAAVLEAEVISRLRTPAGTEAAKPVRESQQPKLDTAPPVAGPQPGSAEAVRQRPTPPTIQLARDGDDRVSHDHPSQRVETNRNALASGIDAAPIIAVHAKLRAAHRLKVDREQALASLAGLEIEALRLASAEAVRVEATAAQRDPLLPPELASLVATWRVEDLSARATRRGKKAIRQELVPAAPARPVSEAPSSSRPHEGPAGRVPDPAVAKLAPPLYDGSPRPRRDTPTASPALAPHFREGPGAIAGSDVLARALQDAHAASIVDRAYDAGRPPPSDDEVLGKVALRLRASGLHRDEVVRHLLAGRPAEDRDASAATVARAVDAAFSERSTAWLKGAPSFVAHAARVSGRAETALYRRLRTEALEQLKCDLDEVWVTRRVRADEVAERHRRRMAWIRDLRWSNRRLQRRGLILAILSVAVELAILRPLLALEQADTAKQRRDLHDAARAATERLRALRDKWRTAQGMARAPSALGESWGGPDGGVPGASPAAAPGKANHAAPHASHHATAGGLGIDFAGQPERPSSVADSSPASARMHDRAIVAEATDHAQRVSAVRGHGNPRPADVGTLSESAIVSAGSPTSSAETVRRGPSGQPAAAVTPDDVVSHKMRAHVLASAARPAEPDGRSSFHNLLTAAGLKPSSGGGVEASSSGAGTAQGRPGQPIREDRPSTSDTAEPKQQWVAQVEPLTRTEADAVAGASVPASAAPPSATEQPRIGGVLADSTKPSTERSASVDSPAAPDNGDARAVPFVGARKPTRPDPAVEVRRRLVARYGLVLAARKAWSDARARRLAALAPVEPERLWGMAIDECYKCFGQGKPSTVGEAEILALRVAVTQEATVAGFVELIRLMDGFVREARRKQQGRDGLAE